MASIDHKENVAELLQQGIRAIANTEHKAIEAVEEEISRLLGISPRTIRSWKNARAAPDNIPTGQFLGLAWLVLTRGDLGLDWFSDLLRATDIVVLDQPSREWATACLRGARLEGNSPSNIEIEQVVSSLFVAEEQVTSTPSSDLSIDRNGSRSSWMLGLLSMAVLAVLAVLAVTFFRGVDDSDKNAVSNACFEPVAKANPVFIHDQGFSLYQPSTEIRESSILSADIRTIEIDERGVWVGYVPGEAGIEGVSSYDRELKEWTHCLGLELSTGQVVNDFVFFDDVVFVATDGQGVLSLQDNQWTPYTQQHGLPSDIVYSLRIDSSGQVWASTYEGVARLSGERWETVYQASLDTLASNHVHEFIQDNEGNLWFGLISRGISQLTTAGEWQSYYTNDNGLQNVRGIAVDGEKGVWFATDGGGLLRFHSGEWVLFNAEEGQLPSNSVHDVEQDQYDRIWAATEAGVVYTPDYGQTWVIHSTAATWDIDFGCPGCLYDEDNIWLVIRDRGIAHVSAPPNQPVVRVVDAPSRVELHPGDEYIFEVEVEVLLEDLGEGDGLFSNAPSGTELHGAYPIIPVRENVAQGHSYVFSNIDDPIVAPDEPGIYQFPWRVWQSGRFVTEPIVVEFEVVSN